MIKRIFIVVLLTGFSQIISLLSVGFLKSLDQTLVYEIGNYESLIAIFTAIISLGLQLVTVRDIALSDKWRVILTNTQRDRFTLSLFILVSVLLFDIFLKRLEFESVIFYLVIPLIALNADYSFYGKGEPERGSLLSFFRVTILSLFIILSVIFKNPFIKVTFIITILLTYFVVGMLSSYFNKQNYLVKPRLNFYQSYLQSLNVGIASTALVFFGLGIVSYASFFYSEQAIANAYLVIKIYVFYIGIKRLLVQILFKELTNERLVKIVDQIGIISGTSVIIVLFYYPEYAISFFTKDYQKSFNSILYLLPAIFFTSISFAGPLELLLKNKDKFYSWGFILGATMVLITVFVFSFNNSDDESYIYMSISIGELVALVIIGWGVDKFNFFRSRLPFIVFSVVGLLGLNYLLLLINLKIVSLLLFATIVVLYILYIVKAKINQNITF